MKIIGVLVIILITYELGKFRSNTKWNKNLCSKCMYCPERILPDGTVSYIADDMMCSGCSHGCNFEKKKEEESLKRHCVNSDPYWHIVADGDLPKEKGIYWCTVKNSDSEILDTCVVRFDDRYSMKFNRNVIAWYGDSLPEPYVINDDEAIDIVKKGGIE